MKRPCHFKEWIDNRNLMETERHRNFGTLDLSEGQGKYLEELEKERRRSTVTETPHQSLRHDLYERVVKKDEEELKAHEEAIKQ
jgi:hypothetical protein